MKTVQQISKWSYYLALLPVTLGLCLWQGWAWWSWVQSPPTLDRPSNSQVDKAVQIEIPSGTAAQQIGRDLESVGLIRSANAWRLWTYWLKLHDREGGYKAGTYRLSPTQPLSDVADKIWTGEVMQLSFTIPEGWSIQQMATYFESLGYFKAQDFLGAASQIPRNQYPWLPNDLPHLEGYLYPDTYQLPSDRVSPQQVIQQMLKRFEQVALPVYEQAQNQTQLSLNQWVTLASVVEKEAVVAQERPLIAGVFTARLERGMKLESDPTVEYGLGIRQTADQPLTYAQVETPSPYNTYLNPGLTPTPIGSPGLESLKATLNPEKTDYLFFVARYDGTHVFSRTLEAHEAARDAIRQQRNAQKQESP
ncbi:MULTISPECIES: endolytic transglycosylase MltG [unclassified Coleofasciculus]|uniref:endolytic transglycosylase MltG n=1 Tax=unclassified Coleofasciculus TaxID=2692782 RepID=UPI0018826906|nr:MULTISPECIES: endolytic transglycosylase MltG [unclassified Coleofasciculus]MBE9127162.1 endolytic transglycosylase MltG [Coleofasciculus sp. LEGE 07081]MBE9150483.1 endolytic transglycosylase MltG [Coleofasciculus sp. LEGE 07092]